VTVTGADTSKCTVAYEGLTEEANVPAGLTPLSYTASTRTYSFAPATVVGEYNYKLKSYIKEIPCSMTEKLTTVKINI
jgi:hypothetical protein